MFDFSPLTNALSDPIKAVTEGNMGTSAFGSIAVLVIVGFFLAFFGFRVLRFAISLGAFGGGVVIGALLVGKNMLAGILGDEMIGLAAGGVIGFLIGFILLRVVNWLYNRLLFIIFTPLLILLTSLAGCFLVAFAIGGFLPIPFGNLIITGVLGLIAIFVQSKAAIRAKKDRILDRVGGVLSSFGMNAGMVSDDFLGGFMKGYGK